MTTDERTPTVDDEIPDEHMCPDCLEDMSDPDHYGCRYCGGCECQGEC